MSFKDIQDVAKKSNKNLSQGILLDIDFPTSSHALFLPYTYPMLSISK